MKKEIEILRMMLEEKFMKKYPLLVENGIICMKNKEIERLNNIINELEKTLLEWHEYWEDNDEYQWQYKNAYDYLQELKGSDKE